MRLLIGCLSMALAASSFIPLHGATFGQEKRVDLKKFARHNDTQNIFGNISRQNGVAARNLMMRTGNARFNKAEETYNPSLSLGPAHDTGDLNGPNGEKWFYTADYDYEVIPADYEAGIWYDDYILRGYVFTIYDAKHNAVGKVKSDVVYAEDEQRVVSVELTPVVSRHFFNTDDKTEVIVALAVNTKTPGMNRYKSLVYQLDGEKDSKGNDRVIKEIPMFVGDVVEGLPKDGRDNFFMTFTEDYYPSESDLQGEDIKFWDYLTRASIKLHIYGRSEDATGPKLLADRTVPLLNLPGDQENSPFMMSFVKDGKVTYLFSTLDEPLWEEYNDPIQDEMYQRSGNKLSVEFFTADGAGLHHEYTTKIDVVKDESDEFTIASFFSVGDMRYREDLLYNVHNAPEGKACLVITRANYNPSSDSTVKAYFVYDWNGKLLYTLSPYCSATMAMSDIEGFERQQLFINQEGSGYVLSFVDIISGKESFWIPNQYEVEAGEEPEQLIANIDRVAVGDSYKYCCELYYPVEDEGRTFMRVLWMDSKGKFDRIDMIDAGENVLYGQFYIDASVLKPETIHADSEMEYLFLVKRGEPGAILSEEFIVAQPLSETNPEGKTLLQLGPDDRGVLGGVVADALSENPVIVVYYLDNGGNRANTRYTQELYKLPLVASEAGICAPGVEESNGNPFDGTVCTAGEISVFTANGVKVAEASGRFDINGLPSGLYIVVADGKAVKVVKNNK